MNNMESISMSSAYLNKFLASRVTGVQFDRRETLKFGTQMCTGRLPNARRSRNHHSAKSIHAAFPRLLEIALQARRPRTTS
jgi:hypothetical protein